MNETVEKSALSCADMSALLSVALNPPAPGLADGLADGSFADDVVAIAAELAFDSAETTEVARTLRGYEHAGSADAVLSELRADRFKLLGRPGGGAVALTESSFMAREDGNPAPMPFVNALARDVLDCYQDAGLTSSRDVREPADSMAVELGFMRELFLRMAPGADPAAAANALSSLDRFYKEHFSRWPPGFFGALEREADCDFYRACGRLGSLFASWLGRTLG